MNTPFIFKFLIVLLTVSVFIYWVVFSGGDGMNLSRCQSRNKSVAD
jgi:hypothetical protein